MPRTQDEIWQLVDNGFYQRNQKNYLIAIEIFDSIIAAPEFENKEYANREFFLNRAYHGKASCYFSQGDIKKTREYLDKMTLISPSYYILSGLCYEQEGKIDEAQKEMLLAKINLYKKKNLAKFPLEKAELDKFLRRKQTIQDFFARHPKPDSKPLAPQFSLRVSNRFACLEVNVDLDVAQERTRKKKRKKPGARVNP